MRHFRLLSILALGCFATIAVSAKADNLVSNPDFAGATSVQGNGYGSFAPTWTSPLTFLYSGDPGKTGSGSRSDAGPFNFPALPAGVTDAGFIQAYTGGGGPDTNSLAQTLNTVVGTTYTVSFLENARATQGGAANLTASIGDFTETSVVTDGAWILVSGEFTATTTSETLTFSNTVTGGSDATVLVTDVNVSAVTPEPSSLALLGTGLVGLAGAIRRKVRK